MWLLQQVHPPPCGIGIPYEHWDPIWAFVCIVTAPLAIQISAYGLGRQQKWSKSLGPCANRKELEEAPGSCFWISYTLTIVALGE